MSGCTVQQQFSFKKDFSGTSEVVFDMSTMMSLMKTDSTSSDSAAMMKQGFSQLTQQLDMTPEQIPLPPEASGWGISDARFKKIDEGKYQITMSFKNLDGLNKYLSNSMSAAGGAMGGTTNTVTDYFSIKGKVFTYQVPGFSGAAGLPNMGGASPEDISKLMVFKTTLIFEHTIKKVESENLEVVSDKHSVSFTIKDLGKTDKKSKLVIKLK